MTDDMPAAALLELDTEEVEATPQETAAPGRPSGPYWPLVVLIAVALTVLGTWALLQPRTADEVVDATPQTFSDHDSLIEQLLRDGPANEVVPPQHDAHIGRVLRDQEATPRIPPQHDAHIAAQLQARGGTARGCDAPADPGVAQAC